jgi:hypothetical protein
MAALGTARRLGMTVFAERAGDDLARASKDSPPEEVLPSADKTAEGGNVDRTRRADGPGIGAEG